MKRTSKKISRIIGIAILIAVGFFPFASGVFAKESLEITSREVIKMVNNSRQAEGLEVLVENKKLSQAAEAKAADMLKENYFAHNSPGGKTPWFWIEEAGYDYHYAGENLAMDFNNVTDQHLAWMKSPTHRKNILNNDFREIGVAVKRGFVEDHLAIITVQEFGTPSKFIPSSAITPPATQTVVSEKTAGVDLKSVPILDKDQLSNSFLREKLPIADWRAMMYVYLEMLILASILLINPFIIALLFVQFINFKMDNKKELALKN